MSWTNRNITRQSQKTISFRDPLMHNHFFSIFYIFPFAFNFLIMTFFIDVWLAAILEIVINDAEVRDDFGLRRSFQLLLSKRWLRFRGFNRGVISFRSYIHVHIITVSLSCSNEYDFSWDQVCSNKQSNVWVCVYNSWEFSQCYVGYRHTYTL